MADTFETLIDFDIALKVADAAATAVKRTSPYFRALNAAMLRSFKSKPAFNQANTTIAKRMQQAALASYNDRVEAQVTTTPYRIGHGRIGGAALETALSSGDFFRVDPDGISFGDMNALDSAAAQWYRLNFGAGSIAETKFKPGSYPVSFGGRRLAPVTFQNEFGPSRDEVLMPDGSWIGAEGKWVRNDVGRIGANDQFFPTDSQARWLTRGIAGRQYLDAALKVFADPEIGFAGVYQDLVIQLVDQADRTGRGALGGTGITVPIP